MGRPPAGSPGQPDDLGARARHWAETSCAAQGLAIKVSDPAVLASVATLLVLAQSGEPARSRTSVELAWTA